MLEVEVKVKVDNKHIEDYLADMGFKRGATHTEIDTYFNGESKNLREEDKALRIRRTLKNDSEQITLNYKGPKIDNVTMTREEIELNIPSYEDMEALLNGLGYTPAGRVEKQRVEYILGGCTCCIDEVKGLGRFLEIEIMSREEDYDKAIHKINELLEALDLSMEDTVRKSYLCMLQEIDNM